MPVLNEIHRYPIKGFSGEIIDQTILESGHGIENDRRFALSISNDVDGTQWAKSRSFIINSVRDGLLKYTLRASGSIFTLTAPNSQKLSFNAGNPLSITNFNQALPEFVEPIIGNELAPRLIERIKDNQTHGMWDYSDTHLSIINLQTINELSDLAGVELDLRRFRGNLLIDDLAPWQEFAMSGMRYKIGKAEIEVTRPTDRCPATSVNPETGERDAKIPALLADHYGHAFCGIYAHVAKAGKIEVGDTLEEIGPAQAVHLNSQPDNAPDHTLWPKNALVSKADENSISLITAGPWPLLNSANTNGKRMRLHLGRDNILNAEIQNIEAGTITVAVEDNNLKKGSQLLVSGPFGKL